MGAVILHTDITSQALLTERFRRTEAQYGALWENPVDAATLLAADGTIRYQSPASETVLGNRPEELEGRSIFEFVHPEDADAVRKLLRDCLRNPAGKHPCEFRFHNKGGSWRTLEGIARKLLSHPEGGIILNSRDITYRKLAEKTLLAKQESLVRGHEELEALAARLLLEREAERRRLAGELNGNLSQRLASMRVQAAYLAAHAVDAAQSNDFQERVSGLGRDIQHLSGDLYPALLDHFGLAVALREYCGQFTHKQGVPVRYFHRGVSARLPGHIGVTLFRVAEEALCNVARHAGAKGAAVLLNCTPQGMRLVIRDDGAGFDPAAIAPGMGLGILAMRERLRAVGGSLSIRSRPGCGTELVAVAPATGIARLPAR
jgi:PAS domain S-box-containing protein